MERHMPLVSDLVSSILTTCSPFSVGERELFATFVEEIADAIHICTAFNLINRLADAMGWQVQTDVAIHHHADMLLKMGYR